MGIGYLAQWERSIQNATFVCSGQLSSSGGSSSQGGNSGANSQDPNYQIPQGLKRSDLRDAVTKIKPIISACDLYDDGIQTYG